MTIKEIATSVKFWIGFAIVFLGGVTALGATVDRPAWISEVDKVESTVQSIERRVAVNERSNLQMQIDQTLRQIWAQEDRLATRPTRDGRQRIRELKRHLLRLMAQLKKLGG